MAANNPKQPETAPPPLLGRFPGPRIMGKVERPQDTRGTLGRLWRYLQRQRVALLAAALMVVVMVGLDLLGPWLLGRAIDRYILPHNLRGLGMNCLLMLSVYCASALLNWWQSYVLAGVAQRTVRDLRADLFARLQTLPLRFFDQRPHGDLMSRLTNDVENINQVLSSGIAQVISGLLSLLGVTAMMCLLNVRLAIVSIGTVTTITLVLNRWVVKRTREGFRRQQASLGTLNGLIEETITGQRVVKACRREPTVIAQFQQANSALRQAATRAQIYAGFIGPLMNTINNVSLAIVTGVGGIMAVRGWVSVGNIVSFINYTRQFGRPLNDMANLFNMIQSAVAGAERVFAILDETPEIDAPADLPVQLRGEVVLDDVSFAYVEGVPVLKHASLHVQPGQLVALVGPTGAGKTTIVNLLTRFYELESGRITLDGHDIRDIRKETLRRQLGIVLQDTFLFTGTVRENIRYGRLDASDDEIIAAAKLANADQFIHRLPHGYDTMLSERGGNLSQGQRQLLAIARAILADPCILILDEATSNVDTRTEQHIQEAMRRLMAGRTSFVIAHRLSTIRHADQILVIRDGEIIERGTHTGLLAQQGFYHQLAANPLQPAVAPAYD